MAHVSAKSSACTGQIERCLLFHIPLLFIPGVWFSGTVIMEGRSVTSATTAGYPKPLWHQAIKVIALLVVMLMYSLRTPWGLCGRRCCHCSPHSPRRSWRTHPWTRRSHTPHGSVKHQDTLHKASHPVSSLQSPACSTFPAPAFQVLLREDVFSRNKPTASCSLRTHLDEMSMSCGCQGTESALLNKQPPNTQCWTYPGAEHPPVLPCPGSHMTL